jgi:hypothetical protein
MRWGASGNLSVALEPVAAWGLNNGGQAYYLLAPLTNAVAISAGYQYSLALKSDGTVYGWGSGSSLVPAANSNFMAVAAGYNQCLRHLLRARQQC